MVACSKEIYPAAGNADTHQYQCPYFYAVFGVQWNCVVPSHFCGITHSRTDGNSENHAPGGILLGICADEYSFRISLEHGSWTVPQTLEQKENPATFVWLMRFIAIFIAGYGAYCFHKENIVSYMFLKQEFVFLILNRVQFLYLQGISP